MTHSLSVLNTDIRIHDGLYSLNDLHRAAGGEKRHEPHRWLRNDQTKALIEEIECSPDLGITPVKVIKGNRADGAPQGTYACKELVYAYAMWISPRFHLHVIRAFDALVAGQRPVLPVPGCVFDRDLRSAVNRRAHELALEEETKLRERLTEAVGRRSRTEPDRAALLEWIDGWRPARAAALPAEQAREIAERLDRLGRLFHPFSEPFSDVQGLKRLLSGLDPRLGVRERRYMELISAPQEGQA